MGKTGSYIKIDRGLKNNPIWLEKPFSKGQAWVDLLILAQGIDKDKMYRGQIQKMKSGTVYTSILFLTNRWGWSRNKVYRFLQDLMKSGMVEVQGWTQNGTQKRTLIGTNNGTTNGTIISIVKWDVYQYSSTNNETNNGTSDGTNNGTPNGTHNIKHTEKAYKESKQRNKKGRSAPVNPSGFADKSYSETMPDIDNGTVDDIPADFRDQFDNYADYWRFRNR